MQTAKTDQTEWDSAFFMQTEKTDQTEWDSAFFMQTEKTDQTEWDLSFLHADRKAWSDWVDNQADLSLLVGCVMLRLK